jgi:hypothetical protein
MGTMRTILLAVGLAVPATLAACGDPVLANAPRPNTAAMAGGAAALAGAATLAAPDAQGKRVQEANKPSVNNKPVKSGPSVPGDVLDRLDDKQKGSGSDAPKQDAPKPDATKPRDKLPTPKLPGAKPDPKPGEP